MMSGVAASALVCVLALGGCAGIRGSGSGGSGSGGSSSGGSGGTGIPTPPGGTVESIAGDWVLLSGTSESRAIMPAGDQVTLMINGRNSGGNGGCNAFGARATGSTTGPFQIQVGIHTDMACVGDDRNISEQQYFSALGKITKAALSDGDLTLTGPGVTLRFDRARS